jgi:tetratricopeptide (TPR) repeat protein
LLWRTFLTLNLPGAFWAAALWALHPVAVESVAWVTERKNTLSGVFFLAASYVALRSGAAGSAWQGSRYAASLLLYVLALLSKTVTATWPISLALVWWAGSRSLRRERLVRLLPALMIGAALASVTVLMERHHVGAVGADWNLTFLQRLLIASRALWFYLGKLLWPFDLAFIYPRWEVPAPAPSDFVWLAACAFAAAVLAAAVRWVGRWPLAAALYFAVSLGPALGFVNVFPMRYSFVADHYQYLASIGPLSLLVCGSAALWQALRWRGGAAPVALRRAARAAAPVLALSLAALTWSQAHIYRDVETLWRDTLRKNPRAWMAHNNLGLLLLERNELRAAEQHFEQALAVKADDSFAMNNLGLVYARRGELQRAAEWFARAVQIDPTQAEAANNLGNVFAQTGQWESAEAAFRLALQRRPAYAEAWNNLGNVLAYRGRSDEAVQAYERAAALDPDYVTAFVNLARVLAANGRHQEALVWVERALQLEPDNESARDLRAELRAHRER